MIRSKHEVVKVWIAAGLWLGIIVTESSQVGGASNTSRILYPLFHYLFNVGMPRFEIWHPVLRKTGHVVGYFIMSLLFFRAWRATLPQTSIRAWCFSWARTAWMTTTLVASLDEWHQAYVPGRGSTVHDVLLDSAAAFLAQLVIWFWLRNSNATRTSPRQVPVQSNE